MRRQHAWVIVALAMAMIVTGCSSDPSHRRTADGKPSGHSTSPAATATTAPSTALTASGPADIYELRMVSRSDGWGYLDVGRSGFPIPAATTNGARTWHPVSPDGPCRLGPEPPSGPSLTNAWTSTSGPVGPRERTEVTVCHTDDGGQQWTQVSRFRSIGTPTSLQFVDRGHGWLTTTAANGMHSPSDVHLFRTTDGGSHWREVAASATGLLGGHSFGGLPTTCASEVRFVDASTGWYAGGCPQGGGILTRGGWADDVAVTHDGGRHWHRVALPHPRVEARRAGCRINLACWFSVVAVRHQLVELFAGGGAASGPNVLYRSTDGGATWAVEPLPLASTEVATFDGRHLLEVSDESRRVSASDDAGRTWRRLANLPHPAVLAPDFVGPHTALLKLARSHGLYRTVDGGRSWTHFQVTLSPSSGASPGMRVSAPARPGRRALPLLPAPCTHRDVTVASGAFVSPATGEHAQAFEVRLRGTVPCTLWGSPRMRLLDGRGRVMRFHYLHRGLYTSNAPAAPVVVRRDHPGVFLVAKYRCDVTTNPRYAVSAHIRLPFVRGAYRLPLASSGAARIPLCGAGDPPQDLGTSRIRGSYRQLLPTEKPPARPPYAVSMRSPFPSPYGASYGRGDVNGDGRPDLIVVRQSGLVTARISGLGVRRIRLSRDVTLRLQALSTLGQGTRAYAVVATTAHGCCGLYPHASSGGAVIGLRHGRLGVVRSGRRPWDADLDAGVGDLFEGLVCRPGAVTQVSVYLRGPHRLQVERGRFRLDGLRIRRLTRREDRRPGGFEAAMRLSRSDCPGMSRRGWASVASYRRGWP